MSSLPPSAVLILALCAAVPAAAWAEAYVVTKEADAADGACDADCSLREAVIAANANPGLDYIVLPAGTYPISILGPDEDAAATGDLDLTDDVTIVGVGRDFVHIGGAGDERVFDLLGGIDVQIAGLSVGAQTAEPNVDCGLMNREGRVTISDSEWSGCTGGPAITNLGELQAYDVDFRNNAIGLLNGVDIDDYLVWADGVAASALLDRCRFIGHRGDDALWRFGAGAAGAPQAATWTITRTEFSGNRFGIWLGGTATISESVFRDNEYAGIASAQRGFLRAEIRDSSIENNGYYGIWCAFADCGRSCDLEVARSAVRANGFELPPFDEFPIEHAYLSGGGGVYLIGMLLLGDSTLSGNAHFGLVALQSGGHRFCMFPSETTILNSTISTNGEVGLWAEFTYARQYIRNSTLTGHTEFGVNGGPYPLSSPWRVDNTLLDDDCAEGGLDGTGNVARDPRCFFDAGDGSPDQYNVEGADPRLGPLQDNGGPTPTHALLPGSPAINIGNVVPCNYADFETPGVDQRGLPRDAACDAGAYEVQIGDLDPLGLLGAAVASPSGPPTVGVAVVALRSAAGLS